MSRIKEWFLTHIDEFSDEELLKEGYSQEEIDFLKRRDIKMRRSPNKGSFLFIIG